MKKNSEEFLEKEVWWWRKDCNKHPIDFKPSNSLAFNYELVRREKRELRLQSFPAVSGLCQHLVSALDDTPPELLPCRATEEKAVKEKGWVRLTMEWNLNLTNAPLKKAFIDFITYARKFDGIPEPRRNAGFRRRPQPWNWLELMDIHDLKIRHLEDYYQSIVRTARKRAKEKWLIFFNAITQPQKFPYKYETIYEDDLDSDNQEASDFTNFIESAPPVKTPYKLWRGIWPTEIRNK
jgi:hypothetical protein